MTTVGLPDASTYTAKELVSCLVTPSACAYGSEGWGFESLRAHAAQRPFPSVWEAARLLIDDSFDHLTGGLGTGRTVAKKVKTVDDLRPTSGCDGPK
jgi:hypothetical protein